MPENLLSSDSTNFCEKSFSKSAFRLLQELQWIVFIAITVFLFVAISTYDPQDSGWSHTSTATIHNSAGLVGAWLSDLLRYFLGSSAYWLVLGLIVSIVRRWKQLHLIKKIKEQEIFGFSWERWIGFPLLLAGSISIEFVYHAPSPGVLGGWFSVFLFDFLGPVGGVLTLLVFITAGISLWLGFSWFSVFEYVGYFLERLTCFISTPFKIWFPLLNIQSLLDIHSAPESDAQLQAARYFSYSEKKANSQDLTTTHVDNNSRLFSHEAEIEHLLREAPSLTLDESKNDRSTIFNLQQVHQDPPESSKNEITTDLKSIRRRNKKEEVVLSSHVATQQNLPLLSETDLDLPEEVFPSKTIGRTTPETLGGVPQVRILDRFVSDAEITFSEKPSETFLPTAEVPLFKIETSLRAQAERQSSLFDDIPNASPLPPIALLDQACTTQESVPVQTLEYTSRLIEKRLADFHVSARVVVAYPGPVITRYEIEPATGVKGSQVVNLSKDLARALSLVSIRIVETIPGKNLMGLELPNARRQTVRLSEIISSEVYAKSPSPVTIALGKDISGHPVVADLAKMPHLLVAGTTGSGKSVGINAMLLSFLYKSDPHQVRLILIDPKMLEMSMYEGVPHLLAPVVTDMRQAGNALNWCVAEMERRYRLMSKLGVRNISGYNNKIDEAVRNETLIPNPFSLTPDEPEPLEKLPLIVVVIDELADLMMVVGKKVEELIARLAQKARAAGIHLILATQRPSVDVITGLIKANVPSRVAFQVSSKIDSRTILDQMGAESLLGQGDMLYMPSGSAVLTRVHGAYVADDEVHKVVEHWKQLADPQYVEGILEGGVPESVDSGSAVGFGGLSQTLSEAGVGENDLMYDQAVAVVIAHGRATISLVQRHLHIGYNRSARLLEQMEKSGLVSSMKQNGTRDLLVSNNNSIVN